MNPITKRILAGFLVVFLLWILGVRPASRPEVAEREEVAAEAVSAEAVVAEPLSATNTVLLRQQVGQRLTVRGHVSDTNTAKSGRQFLNFYGSSLTVVCAPRDISQFPDGGPEKLYRDKQLQVAGKLERFKGKLQIQLVRPDQIEIVDEEDGSDLPTAELREVEPGVWQSPAGLHYVGRDAEGRTRVAHVLRHAEDIPSRAGPHGVFDGGREEAFGIIDEAWQLAKAKKLEQRNEGRRSTLLVYMGRRIGYLGGSAGREKGHPPLERVFIVFDTGTKNVVTAFPK